VDYRKLNTVGDGLAPRDEFTPIFCATAWIPF